MIRPLLLFIRRLKANLKITKHTFVLIVIYIDILPLILSNNTIIVKARAFVKFIALNEDFQK